MNLGNTDCISAYRTPTRPGMSRPGVVIAEMRCLSDTRTVLERKRYIRHIPQYQYVFFVQASKSHTEQVIDANFNIMLNEMTNGDAYYVSDNGRIRKKQDTHVTTYVILINLRVILTTVIIMSITSLMVAPDQNQHSVMDRVRHMVIGTMITAQHVLVINLQVILDMGTSPGDQKSAYRVVMAGLPQMCTTIIITVKY